MSIHQDFLLSEILYYKIGGKAKTLLEINSREDLITALEFIKENKPRRVLPIGLGSNILINDTVFDGVILWFCRGESSHLKLTSDGLVEVFSSTVLDDLIQFGFSNNLIGLEWAGGLPSTVGGAVRGNVGAFGGEIKDVFLEAEVFDLNDLQLSPRTIDAGAFEFSYRTSVIKQNKQLLVSTCMFRLKKAASEEVEKARAVYEGHKEYRRMNHPIEYPSCGSVFKNITQKENVEKILAVWPDIEEQVARKWYGKVSMGYVIKRLGYSGFQIGGAQVSPKHANYIVNKEQASFKDAVAIIEVIKEKFHETFGFYPEPEIEILY